MATSWVICVTSSAVTGSGTVGASPTGISVFSKSSSIVGGSSGVAKLTTSNSVSSRVATTVLSSVAVITKSEPLTPATAVFVFTLNSDRLKPTYLATKNRAFPRSIPRKDERLFVAGSYMLLLITSFVREPSVKILSSLSWNRIRPLGSVMSVSPL